MYSIFVQIASYRDPELKPTIKSLLKNAAYPDNITICIAHQYSDEDKWDNLNEYKNDGRFIIIDIPHQESGGTCWARAEIQKHYNNEHFTLQLDSHHRFAKNWDKTLIKMLLKLQQKGYIKPLITTYLPSYDPTDDPKSRVNTPWGMSFHQFNNSGIPMFKPFYMEDKPTKPVLGRFYSGHFAFTLGLFCKEVPHDPLLYFHGEEISIAVRAYTYGYDIFYPHKVIAWHEYTRANRKKHWDDHNTWNIANEQSQTRVKNLLGIDDAICTPCMEKQFKGMMGDIRIIKQYERFAGIKFVDRSVQQAAISNWPPEARDDTFLKKVNHTITLLPNQLDFDNYKFIAIIYEDKNNNQIYRKDILSHEFDKYKNLKIIQISSEFIGDFPSKCIIWPYTKKNKWIDKIERVILPNS